MKAPSFALRPHWRRQTQRFDALARRERLLLVVAAAAAALMVADALWLGPAMKGYSDAAKLAAAQPALAAKARAQAQLDATNTMIRQHQLQAELAQLKSRLHDGASAINDIEADLVGADRMLPLLEQMLARHGQLRVLEMRSLPRTDLAAEPAAVKPGETAAARPTLYRHGIELTLEGTFADLVSYLDALEGMPQRLLWGAMRLKVEQHPKAVLTLTVYTLSADRNWIEI